MNLVELFGGPWGPLLIFCLRIVDVSAATSRVLLAVRGDRLYVPIIGFFESMIWIFAVGAAIQSLNSPLHVLAQVRWSERFEKTGARAIDFEIAYLMERSGESWRVLGYISARDQQEEMRALGLLDE